MDYEKIKNDLISEVRLTKNQAGVFLLVTLEGKMEVNQIAKSLDISTGDALETSQKLVDLGGFIDMSKTEFEAMHPRFTAVNRGCIASNSVSDMSIKPPRSTSFWDISNASSTEMSKDLAI